MARSTPLADLFRHPAVTAQLHYEICKAYFRDEDTAEQIASRFSLHPDSVRAIVNDFAKNPDLMRFFLVKKPGPVAAHKRDACRQDVLELRRRGLTLAEIKEHLGDQHSISESSIYRILHREGLAGDGVRISTRQTRHKAEDGSDIPPVADVRDCLLTPGRSFPTSVAGLFLFVPLLLELDFARAVATAGWPGSEMIGSVQAILALLAGKLLGQRRISHISDLCNEEGAGLFAGLNVLPKTTFATDYSYRTQRAMSDRFVKTLLAKAPLGEAPGSFNLDFHAIAYRGEEADLEKHWLAKRNRAGTSIMVFVAQHRHSRVMCYATANVLRDDMDAMAVRFTDYWKEQTGAYPEELLFDGRVTTYEHLAELERRKVGFITVRRRGSAMLRRVKQLADSAWSSCQVSQAKGAKREIRYVDEEAEPGGYPGKVRQIIVTGLGREEPTFFMTNNRPEKRTAREVIQRYAQRNLVENGLGEDIKFFHLDCLSSGVRLNVDFDLTLTVVADLLYRMLGWRLKGFYRASPQKLYRKFIDTTGSIEVEAEQVRVRLVKRAHNPLLREAGLTGLTPPVPWLAGRRLLIDLP
jgi:transposase